MPDRIQKANQAKIQALKGSKIEINLKSNKELKNAELFLDNLKKRMTIDKKNAKYFFEVVGPHEFSIHLADNRGIKNRNPIPFRIEIIEDVLPCLLYTSPSPRDS